MAKTIKFNLICDDKPVRTIEDLRNNFSVEDVMAYFDNKLLHRWLDVRGYEEELDKVKKITIEKPIEIIKELIKIFGVVTDEKKIEESIYMMEYLEERKELCSVYERENYKVKSIIEDYQTGYRQLIQGILENPNDIAKIKANISEIVNNYSWILKLDYRNLYYVFKENSKVAIMCLLMNPWSRLYYLPQQCELLDGSGRVILDIGNDEDRAVIFKDICSMITETEFKSDLGEHLITFSGITDGYWKDLETKDKKYMIISMKSGDFVRSAGASGGDLGRADILNKFVILDGIDYKSNYAAHELLYMEV